MTRTAKHRIIAASRHPALVAAVVAALALAATVAFAPASAVSDSNPTLAFEQAKRDGCQAELASATTPAQRSRAQTCINDAERAIAWLTSPTPTARPSGSPTASPAPSASPTPTVTPVRCPVAGSNVAGGADLWGGCWPGAGNTGVPATTMLTAYTGPCTITAAGTVIDAKLVTCATLDIRAANVTIRNSRLYRVDVTDADTPTASFTITDSTVENAAREQCLCIGGHDFTVLRVEVVGGNRSVYCMLRCVVQDSWLHGQLLQGAQHGSGLREEQFTTARHNTLVCDFPTVDDTTGLGCSADLTGYPDFAPIHDNRIERNLFLASITSSFCAYGGATAGKPFSGSPLNATNQVFVDNVFQRGSNSRCGFYGPVTDFAAGRSGNVWSGNRWDSGELVTA